MDKANFVGTIEVVNDTVQHQGPERFLDGASGLKVVSASDATKALVFDNSDIPTGTTVTISNGGGVSVENYDGTDSFQPVWGDFSLDAAAGSSDGSDPSFLAAMMGNIMGGSLTADANYLAGVIGAYSITGTKATTYPAAGVLGIIMDTVTDCNGAFLAVIDGDTGVTKANAAYGVMSNNSTSGSGFNYGLDLYSPAHDSYLALAILKADIRMTNEVCIFNGAGAPVDGTTGANFAGPGSLYTRTSNGELYINTGSKVSPAWKIVTHA